MRELDATMVAVDGMARFGNNDGYVVGPAEVVFPAVALFAQQVREIHLLHLQLQKVEVFTWSGVLPPEAPQDMKRAGIQQCLAMSS